MTQRIVSTFAAKLLFYSGLDDMKSPDQVHRRLFEAKKWLKNVVELRGLSLVCVPSQLTREPTAYSRIISLDLSHNKLTSLSGLGRLKQLAVLCARNNNIDTITPDICQLGNLTTLDLTHNVIQDVSECFAPLHELKVINLSSNRISFVPESLVFKCKLERLHLTKNPVKNVPHDVLVQGKAITNSPTSV